MYEEEISEVKRCERCGAEEGGYHNLGCIRLPIHKEIENIILKCGPIHGIELPIRELLTLVAREKHKAKNELQMLFDSKVRECLTRCQTLDEVREYMYPGQFKQKEKK